MVLKDRIGKRIGNLSRRERLILLILFALLAVYAGDRVLSGYFQQRQTLRAEVAAAQEQSRRHERLLAMEEWIHAEYRKVEDPAAGVRDSVLTETAVLRELAGLAGQSVHVVSLVPRLVNQDGQGIMLVALECAGQLDAVVAYVQEILNELPSEVNGMTLSPQIGETQTVTCRLSLRIECCET